MVGVAGPGEALADRKAMETLRLVRREDPDVLLCLSTNGLELPAHVRELADLGVSHLTVTVNAVDPAVGAVICGSVRRGGRVLAGREGAARGGRAGIQAWVSGRGRKERGLPVPGAFRVRPARQAGEKRPHAGYVASARRYHTRPGAGRTGMPHPDPEAQRRP